MYLLNKITKTKHRVSDEVYTLNNSDEQFRLISVLHANVDNLPIEQTSSTEKGYAYVVSTENDWADWTKVRKKDLQLVPDIIPNICLLPKDDVYYAVSSEIYTLVKSSAEGGRLNYSVGTKLRLIAKYVDKPLGWSSYFKNGVATVRANAVKAEFAYFPKDDIELAIVWPRNLLNSLYKS